MDVDIPDPPKDANGNIIDSSFSFRYYRDHYWDNVDLTNDALVNNPVFHNKLEYYFGQNMMIQHWDTVLYYAFPFCDELKPKSKMFEYCVGWITSSYGKSKLWEWIRSIWKCSIDTIVQRMPKENRRHSG